MRIIYTGHLEFRLKLRKIDYDLPREVLLNARLHYFDTLTKHYIATYETEFKNKSRDLAVTYDKKGDLIEIITIHPIKPYQKYQRLTSGRWKKI